MSRAVTMKQIAAALELSQASVSFALSPDWERTGVKAETRERVLEKAAELGYVPHRAARRLARDRHLPGGIALERVAWLVADDGVYPHDYVDTSGMTMLAGAEEELAGVDATVTFVQLGSDSVDARVERLIQAREIDAALLYGAVSDALVADLQRRGLPCVVVGDYRGKRPVHQVTLDHAAVARVGVEHLVGLGHQRICCAVGRETYSYQREGVRGFRQAMAAHGLDGQAARVMHVVDLWPGRMTWTEEQVRNTRRWYDALRADPQSPTAILTLEYNIAGTLQQLLRSFGAQIPAELSIVAYTPESMQASADNFTRVELPMHELGRAAARHLRELCASDSPLATPPRQLRIPPHLTPGWSTAAIG